MTGDEHLQRLLDGNMKIAEALATEGRYTEAGFVAGAVLALRAQRTALEPPAEQPKDAPGETP